MKKYELSHYRIQVEPDRESSQGEGIEIRLAFLSDLHQCCNRAESEILFSMLESYRPQLVLCGGDMIIASPGVSPLPTVDFMKQLVSRYPVICGTGNHEYRTFLYPETYGNLCREYHEPLKAAGIRFLHNEYKDVQLFDVPLRIYGYDADRRYYRRFHRPKMETNALTEQLGDPSEEHFSILLAHNPAYVDTYLKWGANLTLCGHYHGGVIRIGNNTGLITPDFQIFSKYANGSFFEHGKIAIVSAGLGEHKMPLRIHDKRELVCITLTSKTEESSFVIGE